MVREPLTIKRLARLEVVEVGQEQHPALQQAAAPKKPRLELVTVPVAAAAMEELPIRPVEMLSGAVEVELEEP